MKVSKLSTLFEKICCLNQNWLLIIHTKHGNAESWHRRKRCSAVEWHVWLNASDNSALVPQTIVSVTLLSLWPHHYKLCIHINKFFLLELFPFDLKVTLLVTFLSFEKSEFDPSVFAINVIALICSLMWWVIFSLRPANG